MARAGGVAELVRSLSRHHSAALVESTCLALLALAREGAVEGRGRAASRPSPSARGRNCAESCEAAICEAGGVGALVNAMERLGESAPAVERAGCVLMGELSASGTQPRAARRPSPAPVLSRRLAEAGRKAIVQAGGPRVIVRAMRTCEDSVPATAQACLALTNLAATGAGGRERASAETVPLTPRDAVAQTMCGRTSSRPAHLLRSSPPCRATRKTAGWPRQRARP
jgi:hypothetical protein